MPQIDIKVPARYYLPIAEILRPLGVDFDVMLKAAGISPQAMAAPNALVRFSQIDKLLHVITQATGRSDIAFELGKVLSVSSHTFVGFAMLNSSTLEEALKFEARYFRLIMPSFNMRYSGGLDTAELYFSPHVSMSALCLSQHLEGIATAALREMSDLSAGAAPRAELSFSIPEPAHIRSYQRLPNIKVCFGTEPTPGVRIRLLDHPRHYPLAIANPQSLEVAESRCKELLQQTTNNRNFADWVSMTLREATDGLPSLEELAVLLNVSKRTLNRYLKREGTNYRELAGDIQYELACKRLASGGMSVTDVALSLGFAEASNFTRAFRARAGCSPSEFARKANAVDSPDFVA